MDRTQRLGELQRDMRNACAAVRERRIKLVCGEGDLDAVLMIVGEAAGSRQNAFGRPFVGPAAVAAELTKLGP